MMLRRILSAGGWVLGGLLIGRVAGILRETLVAARFGAGPEADIAVFLLTVPDFLVTLLVGGAMGSVLIPEFKRLEQARAWRLFVEMAVLVALIFAAIATAAMIGSGGLVDAFAPGFGGAVHDQAAALARIAVWSIPLTAMAAVTQAYLQARDKFAVPAAGTPIFNLTIIACLLLPAAGLPAVAVAILLGSALRLTSQLIATLAQWRQQAGATDTLETGGRVVDARIGQAYGQALVTGALFQFLPILPYIVASLGVAGSLAIYNYTAKLIMVPAMLLGTIFSVVLYPTLSELFGPDGSHQKGIDVTARTLRLALALTVAAALALGWFGTDIARLLFGHGRMPAEGIDVIGGLLAIGVLSLPAHATSAAFQAIMYAKRDTRSAFIVMLITTAVYVPLIAVMQRTFGLPGIMAGYVVATYAVCLGYGVYLTRRHGIGMAQLLPLRQSARTVVLAILGFAPAGLIGLALDRSGWGVALAVIGGTGGVLLPLLFDAEVRAVFKTFIDRARTAG